MQARGRSVDGGRRNLGEGDEKGEGGRLDRRGEKWGVGPEGEEEFRMDGGG